MSFVVGGLGSPEADLEDVLAIDLESAFFLPKPNRLRFFDFGSVLAVSPSTSFSFDSMIVEDESPVVF